MEVLIPVERSEKIGSLPLETLRFGVFLFYRLLELSACRS